MRTNSKKPALGAIPVLLLFWAYGSPATGRPVSPAEYLKLFDDSIRPLEAHEHSFLEDRLEAREKPPFRRTAGSSSSGALRGAEEKRRGLRIPPKDLFHGEGVETLPLPAATGNL